eukprot:TRINITY_DN2756_c0_g1_i2.p1 TRINITY_DN2756_c0_g1~~TRINITY_DN2756_c0_g1_i2.p1  ORF type:complete len:373 (-),score=44.92 TRINITY_DN2756_c0_g1_i2:18-1112(-)
MICCGEDEERGGGNDMGSGRLTETNVVLSSAAEDGRNYCVKLDLIELAGESLELFPGQVVAIEGLNPYGSRVIVKKLFTDASLPQPAAIKEEAGLKLVQAIGPFSIGSDLSYDPLGDLITSVKVQKPDVLVLFGPFVDCQNHLIKSGSVATPFASIFDQKVVTPLQDLEGVCEVILVPSLRDVHHLSIFPQPALEPFEATQSRSRFAERYPHIRCVPNPSIVSVNGLSIGLGSNDILWHLSTLALSRPAKNTSGPLPPKPVRLASHVLQQRSFYPLYPGFVSKTKSGESQLSYKHMDFASLPHSPHLLLLASTHLAFTKELNGTLVVNSSRLIRGDSSGSYSVLHIHAGTENLASRTRVDTLKL